jgi:transposase
MIKAHRIRLHPTPEQAHYFACAAGTARFVFNWGLAEWKRQFEAGEKPSALALKKQFNAIRRQQFPWTYQVTKCVIEGAFMNLGDAFKRFFAGRKASRKVGYPQFKTKKRNRTSFYVANDKFSVGDHWIKLPHIGKVNMAEGLRFKGNILSATISKTASWWFVSITVEMPDRYPVHRGTSVGLDVGINRLGTLSDGSVFENQKPLRSLLSKVQRLSRDLSRKQMGSKNRDKAREKLARLYYRISSIRNDILHKMTTAMAQQYRFIGIEDLNAAGMLKNQILALALTDAALGRMRELLETKVPAAGGVLQKVGRFFPSSKRCHHCHTVKDDLTLSDREFICPNPDCGWAGDRDWNAAINILQEAIRLYEVQSRGSGYDETLPKTPVDKM